MSSSSVFDLASTNVEKVLKFYHEHNIGGNSEWFQSYSTNRSNHFVTQLARIYPLLPSTTRHLSILDIGAAPFVISQALSDIGYNVSAVDLDPDRFDNLHHLGLNIVKGDGEIPQSLHFDQKFDIVLLSHVIEHFRLDLISTLEGIKDLLKHNGILIIETPNLLSIKGWISLMRKGVAYSCAGSLYHEWSKLSRLGHMGHVREYSAAEISDLLAGVGFQITMTSCVDYVKSRGYKGAAMRVIQKIFPSLRSNILIVATIKA